MSSEVHKHTEKSLKKNETLFDAELLSFQDAVKVKNIKTSKIKIDNFWTIGDKSNDDQLQAVIGICFMLGSLFLMGLYSYLF